MSFITICFEIIKNIKHTPLESAGQANPSLIELAEMVLPPITHRSEHLLFEYSVPV